jgi:hypothetical protein
MPISMKINECGEYTLSLLKEYLPNNYHEWEVEFFCSKEIAGSCYPNRKIIQISEFVLKHGTITQIQNVVKHEVAHAAAFTYGNCVDHGDCWKYFCYYMGCPIDESICIDPSYDPDEHICFMINLERLSSTSDREEDIDIASIPWQ